MNHKKLKVLFFFKSDRKARYGTAGYPEDLLYGYSQLGQEYDVEMLEQNELSEWKPTSILEKLTCWLSETILEIKADHIYRYVQKDNLNMINRGDVIIVTTVTQGVTLAILKYWGKLRGELIFCATAVVNHTRNPLFWWIMRRVCRSSWMASLSKGEISALAKRLSLPVNFYVFGTDHNFWMPSETRPASESYVLSVGNDAKRDYRLLVKAWKSEYPLLKIVTTNSLPKSLPANIEQVISNWHMGDSAQTETEAERLRELYRQARFVVTPLMETYQPSGQSVSLQSMACGKALILSDIQGIWDREVMIHGKNCLLCEPGNVRDLQTQIERLLANHTLCNQLGKEGRSTIEQHYTLEHTANSVKDLIHKIIFNTNDKA